MSSSAYRPFVPAARPGGRPPERHGYRVLVHRQCSDLWNELPTRVGLENAQQFYDHVATAPGMIPAIDASRILRDAAGRTIVEGFSRTIHDEITGAGRIEPIP